MPTIVPIIRGASDAEAHALDAVRLSAQASREAPDGQHLVMRLHDVEHRIWLKDSPAFGKSYVAALPFDRDLEVRADAARQLWRALNGRAAGPAFYELPLQRRQRLVQALRALDARIEGNPYRVIAAALFGASRIPERAWKTHDLRNRTIRLVQNGFALMRGGYRALLRPSRRKD